MLILKNTVNMLVASQNSHTAMLESHQLYLQRQVERPDSSPSDNILTAPVPTHNSLFSPHPPILPEAMNEWQLDMIYNITTF